MRDSSSRALSSLLRGFGTAVIAAAMALSVFALTPFASSGAEPDAEPVSPGTDLGLPGGAVAVEELVGQRTARSRTYRLKDGRRLTKLYGTQVNYLDGGKWKPIDTSLVVAGDGGVRVAQAGFDLSLPAHSDGHVRVADDGAWVEFGLQGARGASPRVDGSTARYGDVADGVDLEYRALADGVKESLVLADRPAPARFVFDLRLAAGLRPEQRRSGAIDLVDAGGHTAMSIAAPFMRDAAGAVSRAVQYRLERAQTGWRVTVSADEGWLDDPGRRYPVEVDPSVNVAPNPDCTLDAATPATSLCGGSELEVGWNGSTDRRAALKFDVESVVPKGANVEYGYLAMYMRSKTTSASKELAVYRMTRAWTSAASWNSYDGTNAWTTAGGDFDAANRWDKSQLGTAPPGAYYFFGLTELIQGWRDGRFANQGLIVKDLQSNTTNNVLRFGSTEQAGTSQDPYIGITWDYRRGEQRQFTLDRQGLSDRSQLAVNVANGNLVYRADDVNIAGVGLDLNISSVYNSLGSDWAPLISGKQWNYSTGGGIFLWQGTSTSRVLFGPTGERRVFDQQPDGTWKSPTGIDATLTADGAGWKLKFDKTEQIWRFNSNGDLTKQEDRNGNHIDYSYSAPQKLNQITDTQGRTMTTSYYASGRLHTLQDSSGRVWNYAYDASDRLTSFTDPDNKTTSFTYTGGDDLATITDPLGKVTKLEYDASSRVTAIKSNYVSATNTWTALTSYAYSSPTAPCNSTSDTFKTVVTDPRSHSTTYCADHEARITKVVDANGNTRSATYTPNSDVASSSLPGPAATNFTYASDNLTQVDQPASEQTKLEYINATHPRSMTKLTSPQGTSQVFAYDTPGNLSTVSDGGSPTQVQASLQYNGQGAGACSDDTTAHTGSPRCTIDGAGHTTTYGYDANGNLDKITPELPLGATTLTYDGLSRISTIQDGKSQTRTFSYDPLDRITQIAYSNGATIGYTYDANGNLTQRVDSVAGTSTYQYDALNRRTQDTLPSGTNTYGYDAGSNLTSLTDPGGTVNYRYDLVDRVQDLAEPGGSCAAPVSLCTTFTYTNRDQLDLTTYPNTVVQDFDYDSSDKPTRIHAYKAATPGTALTDFVYVYGLSPSGQSELVQSVTDKDNNKTSYGYDFLARLTSAVEKASGGSGATLDSRSWSYDKATNLKTQTANGAVTSYGYNAANELCWLKSGSFSNACGSPPSGATTFTHDANGNMTADSTGLALAYNIKDQTTSYTPPGGTTTSFAYAGPNQTERTSLGGTTQHNTTLGLTREGSTEWTRTPAGSLISHNVSGTRRYFLNDRLGSIVALTDSTGAVTQTYKYEPYGTLRSSSGSVTNPFRFVGGYRTGSGFGEMYKFGARYYNPVLGRWTQPDPIDTPSDLREGNRYAYGGADPVNRTDPRGTADAAKICHLAGSGLELTAIGLLLADLPLAAFPFGVSGGTLDVTCDALFRKKGIFGIDDLRRTYQHYA
jgi:RHS repeat-associated protein